MGGEWRKLRWGDLASLEYGKGLREYESSTGSYRVFGTNGPIGWYSEPLSERDTVVVGRKGAYRGVHYSPQPCYVIDTAFYLKPKVDFDMRWAYYQLLTQDINGMDSGSAIPSTSRDAFYHLPVLTPPLETQRAIAHVLGTLDDKIELNRRMNRTLEAMAKALFKSWFVDFDPVRAKAEGRQPEGVDAETAAMFPDGFGEDGLPRGWILSTIGEETEIAGGSTPSTKEPKFWDGDYHWVTPKDLSSLSDPILLDTERKITELGLQEISSGLLPKGTVLLSSRAPIGYLAVTQIPVATNQGFISMKCNKRLPSWYVLHWAEYSMEEIKGRANGTTFLEVSKANFRTLGIIVPNKEALLAFEEVVGGLYKQVVLNLEESRTLAALRDALLPKLLSGEVGADGILEKMEMKYEQSSINPSTTH